LDTGLQILDCRDCRSLTELKVSDTVQWINVTGCVWLSNDPNFKKSLEKLIYLQKWINKRRFRIKLKKLIPMIIPIYYHPDTKGDILIKKICYNFLRAHLM
jgi:hypothetical protein